jgi:hypothetical protein
MEWHYATSTGRQGPVNIESLQKLSADRHIDQDTLVWKTGMAEWIPIAQCSDLSALAMPQVPPPISDKAMGNGYIWALALAPIWGSIVQMLATDIRVAITGETFVLYSQMWWVMIVANISVLTLDLGRLKKIGYNTKKNKWWMYLLVPVYIFQRDKMVKTNMTRFAVWIGAFLLSLVIFKF